jgi:hypothetical protein
VDKSKKPLYINYLGSRARTSLLHFTFALALERASLLHFTLALAQGGAEPVVIKQQSYPQLWISLWITLL